MEPELVSDEDPPGWSARSIAEARLSHVGLLFARAYCYDESHELAQKPPFPRDWQPGIGRHGGGLAAGPSVAVHVGCNKIQDTECVRPRNTRVWLLRHQGAQRGAETCG